MARTPRDPNDTSESDHVRAKTVVTSISRLSEKPSGKEACLVVIYGLELGQPYNLNSAPPVIGRRRSATSRSIRTRSRASTRRSWTPASRSCPDLGSTNGTYVNDVQVDECVLRDGDSDQVRPDDLQVPVGRQHRDAYHEEIYRLTIIDGLTQIYNKRYFLEYARARGRARAPLPRDRCRW